MANSICTALSAGKKLPIAGNGGSAGDAQHIADEFISGLMYDRAPLGAIVLTVDTSVITETENDYGYKHIFERQVLGLGQHGDVFLGISTSEKSPNIIHAFDVAHQRGLITIDFCGANGASMRDRCNQLLEVSSSKTAIIQQIHIVAAHIVCALVERTLFPAGAT